MVERLAAKPRPFCTRIKLTPGFGTLKLPRSLADALPSLVELELGGGVDLSEFAHPRVRRLRRSFESMEGHASLTLPMYLPAVEHVTLSLQLWQRKLDAAKVTLEQLPALRTLDVAESEPQVIPHRYRKTHVVLDVFEWLRDLPLLPRLRTLRVPSVRDKRAAKHLAAIAKRAPHTAIEVVRVYSRCAFGGELAPRITFPQPWPWVPDNEAHGRWAYSVGALGVSFEMLTLDINSVLAREFDHRDDAFRDDWRQVLDALDRAENKPVQIPFGLLHRAIAAWPHEPENLSTWCSLRERVVEAATKLTPDQLVTIAPSRR